MKTHGTNSYVVNVVIVIIEYSQVQLIVTGRKFGCQWWFWKWIVWEFELAGSQAKIKDILSYSFNFLQNHIKKWKWFKAAHNVAPFYCRNIQDTTKLFFVVFSIKRVHKLKVWKIVSKSFRMLKIQTFPLGTFLFKSNPQLNKGLFLV